MNKLIMKTYQYYFVKAKVVTRINKLPYTSHVRFNKTTANQLDLLIDMHPAYLHIDLNRVTVAALDDMCFAIYTAYEHIKADRQRTLDDAAAGRLRPPEITNAAMFIPYGYGSIDIHV